MTKYIVKNCPLYEQYDCFNLGKCKNSSCCNGIHIDFCKDISNCLLKQIVDKCKNVECDCLIEKRKCGAMDNMPICCDLWRSKDILSLLEIKECE